VGGVVCRWLLPPAVVVPPALGWLLSTPIAEGQHHTTLNWALYSVFSSAGSVGLILILARRIELLDAERSAATALSRHDALTGLANRRAFDEFLADSLSRAQRYSRALSLLSIDVDDFKRYNDSYGHPAGDEVLKVIARTFAAAAREADLVARIGGEEFAIVLPETDAAGARALGERIRSEVASLRQFRRPVTVSIGVATASRRTPTASVLVKQGDAALYAAKKSGRNCVAGAGHAPLPTPR
jgi:diguanylate cyclase (GGDEF)-like protein